ncbi:MAG: hypothetical protein VYD64_06170 [Pseudomonadota bacterium]|nr:hypothetical protein [Pseudomonadota bacterium]
MTANAKQANVVRFSPRPGARTYRPELVLFEGRKRRQWAVVERRADGTEIALPVYHGRREEAFKMAAFYTRVEAGWWRDFDKIMQDPLGQFLLQLSPDDRRLAAGMLQLINNGHDRDKQD